MNDSWLPTTGSNLIAKCYQKYRKTEIDHAKTSLSRNPSLNPLDSTESTTWLETIIDHRYRKQKDDATRDELRRIKESGNGLLSEVCFQEAQRLALGICGGIFNLQKFEEYEASPTAFESPIAAQIHGNNYARNQKHRIAKKRKVAERRGTLSLTDGCEVSLEKSAEEVAARYTDTSDGQPTNREGKSTGSQLATAVDVEQEDFKKSSGNLLKQSKSFISASGSTPLGKGKKIESPQAQPSEYGRSIRETDTEAGPSPSRLARRERSNNIKFLRERTSSRGSSKHATAREEVNVHHSHPQAPDIKTPNSPHSLSHRQSSSRTTLNLRTTQGQHAPMPASPLFFNTSSRGTSRETDESHYEKLDDQSPPPVTIATPPGRKNKTKKRNQKQKFPYSKNYQLEEETPSTSATPPNLTQPTQQTAEAKHRAIIEVASKKVAIPYQLFKSFEKGLSSPLVTGEAVESSPVSPSQMSSSRLATSEDDGSSNGSSKFSQVSPPLYHDKESLKENLDTELENKIIKFEEQGTTRKYPASTRFVPAASPLSPIKENEEMDQNVEADQNLIRKAEDQHLKLVERQNVNFAAPILLLQENTIGSSKEDNATNAQVSGVIVQSSHQIQRDDTEQGLLEGRFTEDRDVSGIEHSAVHARSNQQTQSNSDAPISDGVVQPLRRWSMPNALKATMDRSKSETLPDDEAEGVGKYWYQNGARREASFHSPWAVTVKWFYLSNDPARNLESKEAGLLPVVRPHQHFPPATRNPRLLYDKTEAPAVLSSVPSTHIYPTSTFDEKNNCFVISPHVVPLADVRSNPSHPDYLPPRKLVEYQAYEISGFDVWRYDRNLLKCQKPGCGRDTDDHELATRICQACGPNSFIRYCCKQHLLDDMKGHWAECRSPSSILKCVVDESTMPPRFHNLKPGLYNIKGLMSFELHRQTIHASFNSGQYTLFTTTGLPVIVKWPTPELESLYASRIERLLNYCLTDSTLKVLVGYLYSLLRYCLRTCTQWTSSISRTLRTQFQAEFQFDAQLAPDTDPCECWWAGGDDFARPRHKHCSQACRDLWKKLGGAEFKGQGLVKFLEEGERHEWLLRVWRTRHPTVKNWRLRMIGEGFEGFTDDDKIEIAADFNDRSLWTKWADVDARMEE